MLLVRCGVVADASSAAREAVVPGRVAMVAVRWLGGGALHCFGMHNFFLLDDGVVAGDIEILSAWYHAVTQEIAALGLQVIAAKCLLVP